MVTASLPISEPLEHCVVDYTGGYFEENPIKLVDNPHVAKKLLPTITDEQVRLLIETANSLTG